MANIWMTRDEMIEDSAILPASFTAKYLDANDEYIDCVYNKNDVLQNRVGVNDTTCDMSFWQNGDDGTNNRFIVQYLATDITNLPQSASTRRISVNIPVYMRNVKYLDICFCVWIDLGYARMTSLSGFNDVSFYFYNKNGEKLKGYCIPTQGNDHPGTGRLSIQGSPGFVPFRFLYDDDENPADIDFISLEFSGAYSEQNLLNIWISQPCYNEDIEFTEEPQPEQQGGYWGETTDRRGGDGTFSAPSDNRGDSGGTYLINYETAMRDALNDGFNNGGVKIYQIAGQYAGDVIGVLFGSDYFDKFLNSMYNPLSAILSYHMIPTSLRGDAYANNIPLTAGGFNISAKMTTPTNFPQINSVKKLHVGSVNIAKYFGAYPDFAPHTQAILHLPYIGDITIDINAIMYGTLSVDYFCDNVSGNVAAWIWCSDKKGIHTYKYIVTGNCAYTIPLYSQSQNGGAVGKIMSSGVSLVGGLLSGNAAGAVGGAIGIAEGSLDAATTPRNTQTTGGNSGNASMLGDSVVWLEITRPQWVNPAQYQKQSGIPSQISGKISDFRGGFFQIETVDLENVPATDSEIAELEQILKDGIYYNFE